MIRYLTYILIMTFFSTALIAQKLSVVAYFDSELHENSGMAFYGAGILYLANDGGNSPKIYRYDTSQKSTTSIHILNAPNTDWEDLCVDAKGNLFIGDFGNNDNKRKDLHIYIAPNPEQVFGNSVSVDTITFRYETQILFPPSEQELHYDCEAMVWRADSLYLFTKNRTDPFDGWCYMYVLPSTPGEHVARLRDSIQLQATDKRLGWITAADLRGDSLLLLSSSKVHLGVGFGNRALEGMSWRTYNVGLSQKEAIAFGAKSTDIFISDELNVVGNQLYYLNIANTSRVGDLESAKYFEVQRAASWFGLSLKRSIKAMVYVYSIMGPEVLVAKVENDFRIDQQELPAGTYYIQILVEGRSYGYKWAKTE